MPLTDDEKYIFCSEPMTGKDIIQMKERLLAGENFPPKEVGRFRRNIENIEWQDIIKYRHLSRHAAIRDVFNAGCGEARYVSSELGERDGHKTVAICFEILPEGRRFYLDGVVHDGDVAGAVDKIAGIAKNVRQHIAPD